MGTQIEFDDWGDTLMDADLQRRAQGLPCDAALPAATPVTTFRCDDQRQATERLIAPQPRVPGTWWGLLLTTIVVVAGICAMTLLGRDRQERLEPEPVEKPEKIDKPLPTDAQQQVLERLRKLLEN